MAVGLAPDLPVEVPDVVAADVLAVLHELDGVPEEGAFVHAGDEPLDGLLGAQVEPRRAGNDRRVKEAARAVGVARGWHSLLSGLEPDAPARWATPPPRWRVRLKDSCRGQDAKIFLNRSSRVRSPSRLGVS